MGAWIEIRLSCSLINLRSMSLPSWERGLKFLLARSHIYVCFVAPLVGAWIGIRIVFHVILICEVAPLVGAWIEILYK